MSHSLHNTRAQTALGRPGVHTSALRDIVASLIEFDDVDARLGGMISALDVRYPPGDGHPLVGRRMSDVDLTDGRRTYQLLHAGRPVLLDLSGTAEPDGRVEYVSARCAADRWTLPVIGDVDAPAAVLVRPDGYVAWAATDTDTAGLDTALATRCGRTLTAAGGS